MVVVGWVWFSGFCAAAAVDDGGGATVSSCVAALDDSSVRTLAQLSFAAETHVPRWHLSQDLWEIFRRETASKSGGPDLDDDDFLEVQFETASSQILACWSNGYRYWSATLTIPKKISAGDARFSWLPLGEDSLLRGGICAPHACERDDVASEVFPRLLLTLHINVDREWSLKDAQLEELEHWMALNLDFAIVGFSGCGTTSLHQNLGRHPDIRFQTDAEDGFFTPVHESSYTGGYRMLPTKEEVATFNARWKVDGGLDGRTSATTSRSTTHVPSRTGDGNESVATADFSVASLAATTAPLRVPPPLPPRRYRVLGSCNPLVIQNPLALLKLFSIRRLRVLAVVCDPLNRFERKVHMTMQDMRLRGAVMDDRSFRDRLVDAARSSDMGGMLERLTRLFGTAESGGRLMVLHQEELRRSPREAYRAMTSFLGVSPFPEFTVFGRYNSYRGPRTGLCSNATLLRMLKRRLSGEYERLMLWFLDKRRIVPEELYFRRTRCQRPDLIAEGAESCYGRRLCTA
eukprot:TRINITY_DN75290_c0_g1_i1.p1 TRINITY_DN75290_c0_g1~~TRINITY_DN75290_c0_g1_i1.p1  ORF type:complete len:541 (+),score=71.72 TRINITY_DN75290_c0_g1_i1:71-1624(+)